MSRKTKKCPLCSGTRVIKRGIQDGVQIYQCKECTHRFRNKRTKTHKDIWDAYVFHKQTIRELIQETGHDKKTILRYLKEFEVKKKTKHRPREIKLVVDATYFGKRMNQESWGVILFRDSKEKENLWWKYVDHEHAYDYLEGKEYLEKLGYVIKSVTADGFLGLPRVFTDIPFQMCHFHMKQIVIRNITLRPQTEAGQVLLALIHTLTYTKEEVFKRRIQEFHLRYALFLNEKTIHPDGSSSYTHEGVRSAYMSLVHWFPYLFTYTSNRDIPNTTNTCDGHFSHIKDILRIHRGVSKAFKQKIIDSILLESTIAPKDK